MRINMDRPTKIEAHTTEDNKHIRLYVACPNCRNVNFWLLNIDEIPEQTENPRKERCQNRGCYKMFHIKWSGFL